MRRPGPASRVGALRTPRAALPVRSLTLRLPRHAVAQDPLDTSQGRGRGRGARAAGGALDRALGGGGGGGGERLTRLELMQKRREEAARNGFATGFDVTTAEERRKREERASRYGNTLIGISSSDVAAAADAAAAAADAAAKRVARAAKFGADAAAAAAAGGAPGMELDVDFLEPRKDAAPDAPIRPDCVHLYGVDTMSTGDCMGYFGEYGPVFCEWINDSSCNIVFADAFTAKRAMVAVVRVARRAAMRVHVCVLCAAC